MAWVGSAFHLEGALALGLSADNFAIVEWSL